MTLTFVHEASRDVVLKVSVMSGVPRVHDKVIIGGEMYIITNICWDFDNMEGIMNPTIIIDLV